MARLTLEQEQADRLEAKLDRLLELAPTINAIGAVLVRQNVAADRAGLHKNTVVNNNKIQKFDDPTLRKTFIQISEIQVVKRRKRTGKHT